MIRHDRKIELVVTDAAKRYLADSGYSPVYGARPLKRMIQKEVETGLSRMIVAGEVAEGARVVVDAKEDRGGIELRGGVRVQELKRRQIYILG